MPALDPALRIRLENTVMQARQVAEKAALAGLTALGVASPTAPAHLKAEAQRLLRIRLRARGKQLGDDRQANGTQDLTHLVWDTAYEHWHQMLFARFLAENGLLMHPDGVAITLDDCRELVADPAEARGATTAAQLAAVFATAMLPQIFRPQDPVLAVPFAPEHQKPLEQLVEALPAAVFTAEDSLGWVYQFWQAKRKDEVNDSEVKIGADELPAVTQLFTEPYMVQFLLHNSLGAWWAAKRIPQALWTTAASEDELRAAAAKDLTGYAFTYLRFVRGDDGVWAPAAGTFPTWPVQAKDLKTLDPCCGSGHFLVALLHLLTRFRLVEERLEPRAAVDAVLRDNLHGLEIDPRCTQIAAFAVALAAWTFPGCGGHRKLPAPHIACSGLRVAAKREEWMAIADRAPSADRERLRQGMGRLWDVFQQAPVLGSLLDPGQVTEQGDLFTAGWAEVQPLLATALSDERVFDTEERAEIGVTARGLADAAQVMSGRYQLVVTNVPYLARGKQHLILAEHCENHYPTAKADLANVFLERCLELATGGVVQVVMPQNWLFLKSYRMQRERLLIESTWNLLARLGPGAFATIGGEIVNVVLLTQDTTKQNAVGTNICGVDVSAVRTSVDKGNSLITEPIHSVRQLDQLANPDCRITLDAGLKTDLLSKYADGLVGAQTGDDPRYVICHWEVIEYGCSTWEYLQGAPENPSKINVFDGQYYRIRWECGNGSLLRAASARPTQGQKAIGNQAIAIHRIQRLRPFRFSLGRFHQNLAIIFPENQKDLIAIWCFCSSPDYNTAVRRIDQKLNVTNATLVKVPIDLDHWTEVAQKCYPHGLPKPYTDDPTQWIFHGHPCGSVTWSEDTKRTAHGLNRRDDTVLPVALARLLDYRWPAEQDTAMDLDDEQRTCVQRCANLLPHADADGIVGIASLAGERPAAERLRELLAAAYGRDWSPAVEADLLAHDGARTLDDWLRDKAFARQVELFQNKPFVWHIWDGRKDGFHAFVNYHKLDNRLLERLIHTYLQEWIDRQNHEAVAGKAGADLRLASAQALRAKLLAIHQGDAPFDIFVRWKPLHEQPVGWNPDFNDGVRLNIRPWITAEVLRVNLKAKIKYGIDRGKDPEGSPWGSERDNDRHLTLAEKKAAQFTQASKGGTNRAGGRGQVKR